MNFPTYVVVLDIGGTKIASAIAAYEKKDTCPTLLNRCSRPTEAAQGGDHVLDNVCDAVALQLEYAKNSSLTISGIGVDTAGCVNSREGSILYANEIMPGWTGQPIAKRLGDEFGLAVSVMNDVHGHAQGEARWGSAKGLHSALVVAAGTGIGGAYVLEGKVVRGSRGAAGHIGHSLAPAADGFLCSCGKTRHIESVASGTGIGALYQNKALMDEGYDPQIDGAYVSKLAYAGDKKAHDTLDKAGFALGESIGSWINLFDPAVIVLSGSVTKAGPIWKEALVRGVESQVMPLLKDTPIVEASLGDDAPLIGAAEDICDLLKTLND